MIKDIEVNSVTELHVRLDAYRKSSRFKFRGQSDATWALLPKAGRPPYTNVNDHEAFRNWKRRAVAYITKEQNTDWELLAIAQHTGLPTRLLDWTHNPLAAAFFATVELYDRDGAIYAYKPDTFITDNSIKPFELKGQVGFYQPMASSTRIMNQFGYFSIHIDPTTALDDKTKQGVLERLIVKAKVKQEILFMLNQYGVNYVSLFPDLEGLAKHMCWFAENYKYWDNAFAESDDKNTK